MTESRPPGGSRHADPRSSDLPGANPLQRPLPPGLGRRPTENGAGGHGSGSGSSGNGSSHSAAEAANPSRPAAGRGAAAHAAPATVTPRRERPEPPRTRSRANGSAIPLMAPPAWQVAGLQAEEEQLEAERDVADQRGLPGWAGLLVLLAITGVGGIIDAVAGAGIKGTFSIGLVVGSLAAILLVKRSSMFPIVVAPPLVYFIASAVLLYVRSGGLSDRAAITDAAASWLVYGFPAIAGATALVLIVAGGRMILHR